MIKADILKQLYGGDYIEEMDSYVIEQMCLFIPYDNKPLKRASFPSYMVVIYFDQDETKKFHYYAEITSPNIRFNNFKDKHFYLLLIDKNYFTLIFLLYNSTIPIYRNHQFALCADILRALNTFAFESSKEMLNSHITLNAQAEIITHWLIRSIFGETLDMRAISSDYSIAKAQHYMEMHYFEEIKMNDLAQIGYSSLSTFLRNFKKETGITPFAYLLEIRLKKAKILLIRKNISITEIADRCGFSSVSHFSSSFQEKFHLSPSEYRQNIAK